MKQRNSPQYSRLEEATEPSREVPGDSSKPSKWNVACCCWHFPTFTFPSTLQPLSNPLSMTSLKHSTCWFTFNSDNRYYPGCLGCTLIQSNPQFSNISHLEKFGSQNQVVCGKMSLLSNKTGSPSDNPFMLVPVWSLASLRRQRRECVSMSQFSTNSHIVSMSRNCVVNIFGRGALLLMLLIKYILLLNTYSKSPWSYEG